MTDGKDHFVYVVGKDNKVEKRKIITGKQVYDRQVVISGLVKGEKVIIGGLHKTVSGGTVNPVGKLETAK